MNENGFGPGRQKKPTGPDHEVEMKEIENILSDAHIDTKVGSGSS